MNRNSQASFANSSVNGHELTTMPPCNWLASTPVCATKNTIIRSYAQTVFQYDPATATQ